MDWGSAAEWAAVAVSVLAALISWGKARSASKSATAAAADQARATDALVKANELYAAANPPDLPPWSDAEWISGGLFRVRHEGTRPVHVESVTLAPGIVGRLSPRTSLPATLQPGDTIEYVAAGVWGSGTLVSIIRWSWEGDHEVLETSRSNVKP